MVTYRSSLAGSNSEANVAHLTQWVQEGNAAMVIRTFLLDILNPPNCSVAISSLTEAECAANDQGPTPRTLLTSDPAVIDCVDRCMTQEDPSWSISSCNP